MRLAFSPSMQPTHAADLVWYFGEGQSTFRQSSLGVLLERAQAQAFDSEGKRIPRPARDDWHTMRTSTTRREPSYTPDDVDLVRAASVSRLLRRLPIEDAMVLQVYFGDIGERWARTRAGRLFSLYALTPAGQKWLGGERPSDVRPDERIAGLTRGPRGKEHRALLVTMHAQAERLLSRATRAWEDARG